MPLNKSGSKDAIGENIAAEVAAGKGRKQAIAIALDVQRRSGESTAAHEAAGKNLKRHMRRYSKKEGGSDV